MGKHSSKPHEPDEDRAARKAAKREKRRRKEALAGAEKKEKKSKAKNAEPVVNDGAGIMGALESELAKDAVVDTAAQVTAVGGGADSDDDNARGLDAHADLEDALVPFAWPLITDPKEYKRVMRAVKKASKARTLRRGVKESVKAIRKSGAALPWSEPGTARAAAATTAPPPPLQHPAGAMVLLAGDVSPVDVLSHLPVLCEDHAIPYAFVRSRRALGEASCTKRPTSVVVLARDRAGKKLPDGDAEAKLRDARDALDKASEIVVRRGREPRA